MQIFADRIEFCWIHLRGISALENSLWAYDAHGIRIWLNALAIEQQSTEMSEDVKESVTIPLAFYPLCEFLYLCFLKNSKSPSAVLMDKGIIIGAENELATRSNLPFVIFRHATSVGRALIIELHITNQNSSPISSYSISFCIN